MSVSKGIHAGREIRWEPAGYTVEGDRTHYATMVEAVVAAQNPHSKKSTTVVRSKRRGG